MKKREHTQTAITISIFLRELVNGNCTAKDLAEETGASHGTILAYIRAAKKQKAIHVAEWVADTNGRMTTRSYALGNKPDAKRNPMPRIDVVRAYRARQGTRDLAAAFSRTAS